MEVNVICNCEECCSTLVEIGCVNVLCDIPKKPLEDFAKSLKGSLYCDPNKSCELYEKLKCTEIHVILVTSSRGFEGLDLLSLFYDLSSCQIVSTRATFVLSNIYYTFIGPPKYAKNSSGTGNSGKRFKKVFNNLKESKYNGDGTLLTSYLNNNQLHLLSYSQPLQLKVTVSNSTVKYTNNGLTNDVRVKLDITAFSNGFTLGSCNYLLKHELVNEPLALISKSLTYSRYVQPFNFDLFNPNNITLLLPNNSSNVKTKSSPVKDQEKLVKDEDNGIDVFFTSLSEYALNCISAGSNVIIPIDINYEFILDFLLNLCNFMQNNNKQACVYCIGEGLEELFDFYDKSCEWVDFTRAEYTMDPNEPKSPFPELDDMKMNNNLFILSNFNELVHILKSSSIIIYTISPNPVLKVERIGAGKNNKYLILQEKYLNLYNDSHHQKLPNSIYFTVQHNDNYKNKIKLLYNLNDKGSVKLPNITVRNLGFVRYKLNLDDLQFLNLKNNNDANVDEFGVNKLEFSVVNDQIRLNNVNDGDVDDEDMVIKAMNEKLLFGSVDYNNLFQLVKEHYHDVNILKKPESDLVILTSTNLFNILINIRTNTVIIDTNNYQHLLHIHKLLYKLLIVL